jgi:hypothetical protein
MGPDDNKARNPQESPQVDVYGAPSFPADWVGRWFGVMTTEGPGGENRDPVTVLLTIEPVRRPDGALPPGPNAPAVDARFGDRYRWKMEFTQIRGGSARDDRTEEIVLTYPDRWEYAIERGSGGTIPIYDMMGPLCSITESEGRQYVSRYELDDLREIPVIRLETLAFEVAAAVAAKGPGGEGTKTWRPLSIEHGELRRVDSSRPPWSA